MIKVVVAVVRNPQLSVAEFHRYWRENHAALVTGHPVARRYIKKYVQSHASAQEYSGYEPAFDGFAELWFESRELAHEFFSNADYLAVLRPDEEHFADMTKSRFVFVEEATVIDVGASAAAVDGQARQ